MKTKTELSLKEQLSLASKALRKQGWRRLFPTNGIVTLASGLRRTVPRGDRWYAKGDRIFQLNAKTVKYVTLEFMSPEALCKRIKRLDEMYLAAEARTKGGDPLDGKAWKKYYRYQRNLPPIP